MDITFISDTHGLHRKVKIEPCDILVHSGDFMGGNSLWEFEDFLRWLKDQPAKDKVLIAGNHDRCLEETNGFCRQRIQDIVPSATYLEDSGATINGLKFWGSPVTPRFYNWAFNRDRGPEINRHWDMIPSGIDIIVTHGPPFGILDLANDWANDHLGCEDLFHAVDRVEPKIHCFGHIHGSGGKSIVANNGTLFINAAIVDEDYKPVNKPIVITI